MENRIQNCPLPKRWDYDSPLDGRPIWLASLTATTNDRTMTQPAARSRAELRHYATTYEVVAEIPGEVPLRLGFTSRVSRRTLISLARDHAADLLPHVGDNDPVSYSAAGGLRLGNVVVRKSGRTERECA